VTALVGHELRAPLAAALLYVGIARRQARELSPSGDLVGTLAVVGDELKRLERLVSRVVELEASGRAVIRPQHVDLAAVVSRTVAEMLVIDDRTRPNVTFADPGPVVGWWDDMAVEEIVRNLMSNALRFGDGEPIHVGVERVKGGARILVQDHGPGIPASERRRIFKRGVRDLTPRRGGLGLGLWLVRELVRAHGGRVTVKDTPGGGATFTAALHERLPETVLPVPERDIAEESLPQAELAHPGPSSNRLIVFARELLRAQSFADVLAATWREVRAATGYQHVWFLVLDGENTDQLRLIDFSGQHRETALQMRVLNVRGDRFLEEVVASLGPVVIADARTDPRTNKQIVEQLSNRTLINIPLLLMDERLGVFGIGTFGNEACRAPTQRELDYLVAMAGQIAVASGRIRFLET
jgi:anti-sigma regulatory factor (Ser/Thr protein kinase)